MKEVIRASEVDVERLKVDPDYWDEVAPDGAVYFADKEEESTTGDLPTAWVNQLGQMYYEYSGRFFATISPNRTKPLITKPEKKKESVVSEGELKVTQVEFGENKVTLDGYGKVEFIMDETYAELTIEQASLLVKALKKLGVEG